MKALILKIGAFFIAVFAIFKWGEATAEKNEAESKADEAVEASKLFEDINSEPYVDNPADFLCFEEED